MDVEPWESSGGDREALDTLPDAPRRPTEASKDFRGVRLGPRMRAKFRPAERPLRLSLVSFGLLALLTPDHLPTYGGA